MSTFAERLRLALNNADLKPSVLSYKTGISEASISHYLAGHYVPKTNKTKLLAKALRVSELWLNGYDLPMYEYKPTENDVSSQNEGELTAKIAKLTAEVAALTAENDMLKREIEHKEEIIALHNYYNKLLPKN